MKRKLWLVLCLALALGMAGTALAKPRPKPKLISGPEFLASKATLDTVFFDNFESDTLKWDSMDIAVQVPYWHIDTYSPVGAYSGHHWWCGTNEFAGSWKTSPGYGCGWVQMLYSPDFDLTGITSDSVRLSFYHYYSVEPPTPPADDWDCVNLWGSTDAGATWFILYPDTMFSEGAGAAAYNLKNSYAWKYTGLFPDSVKVPGWGGSNGGWKQVAFDLSAYKGQTLSLRFATVSDPMEADEDGGPYNGAWYIDNIALDTLSNGGAKASLFFDDAETGNLGWTAGSKIPVYRWHKTTYRAKSAIYSWYCGDEDTKLYTWGHSDAIVSPLIDLSEVQNTESCYLDFAIWADVSDDGSDPGGVLDNWSVDISVDSGKSWKNINPFVYLDATKDWTTHTATNGVLLLNDYIGKTVKVRIAFSSDGDELVGEGLYVDDFIITGKTREPLPPASTICLVDNDGNAVDLADNSWTKYLESSLANLGYRYSLVTIGSNKVMPAGYLEQFPLVIWNLGSNFDGRVSASYKALTPYDQGLLKSYLDNGGRLWMSGQYYFFANGEQLDTTAHPNLWRDYLHLAPDNGWSPNVSYLSFGVSGDELGDGLSDSLLYDPISGGGYPWTNPYKAYTLNPDTPAFDVFGFMANDDGSFSGLRYNDPSGYQFVYTAFPFEALSTHYKRDTLAARIIGYLLDGPPEYDPPAVPTGLAAVQEYDSVLCTWDANSEPDLAGYNVYRALQTGMPFWVKLGSTAANAFVDTTIVPGAIYHYAVTAYDDKVPANQSAFSPWVYLQAVDWKSGTEGEPAASAPRYFALGQNSPNPFGGTTSISFSLPVASRVKLSVYNITGQLVRTLVDGSAGAGHHQVAWNGRDQGGQAAANGIYFYRMEAAGADGRKYAQTKRLNLVK